MPLHLLGKKSWNVYNADNIARVRRDEAAAAAAEEAEEQRMQEVDAERRLAILRGEEPPPLLERSPKPENVACNHESRNERTGRERRPRKKQGEDDTDFEMRLAESRSLGQTLVVEKKKDTSSAPIVDHTGHIDLFGSEKQRAHAEKNEDAERQKKKKQQDLEDQYKIRLATAAGKNAPSSPWYSQGSQQMTEVPTKDVWGNDDPRRKDRQIQRLNSSDPLAMMKSGAKRVRELKKERKVEREERNNELADLIREERHKERKERRRERSRERRSGRNGDGVRRRSRSRDREERRHRHRDDREKTSEHRDRQEHRATDRRDKDRRQRSRRRSRSRSPRR